MLDINTMLFNLTLKQAYRPTQTCMQALKLVGEALQDAMVRTGLRLEILLRGKKILNMKCMKATTSEEVNTEKRQKKSKKSTNKNEFKEISGVKKLIEDDEMNHLKQATFVCVHILGIMNI